MQRGQLQIVFIAVHMSLNKLCPCAPLSLSSLFILVTYHCNHTPEIGTLYFFFCSFRKGAQAMA